MNARLGSALVLVLAAALAIAAGSQARTTAPERAPVVVHVDRGGFHWLDAGVGAVGALAAAALVFGLLTVLREQQSVSTREED